MNIAFFISSRGWGGLEMNTLKLARLLSDKGYNISLITQEDSTIYENREDLFSSTILIKRNRKYFDFKTAKTIAKALKLKNIDILIAFDNIDLDVIAWTKKLFYRKLKIIYQQHMQIGLSKKDFLHTFRFKSINYWISPLEYLKNEIAERTNFPVEKVKVIPLCLDTTRFTKQKYTKAEALQKLNINPKNALLGIIGRISEKKGQLFVVETVMKLKQKGINVELLIFGSPTINETEGENYYKQIKETVLKNNLENTVHFIDYQKDVSLFYNAVDVFVLASHSETYGMVTIEAMLSKLPIIATQSGGTSEILEYGKLGLLYEYQNHEELSEKIIQVLNNMDNADKMAGKAQQTATESYELQIEVNEIDKLIGSLSTN